MKKILLKTILIIFTLSNFCGIDARMSNLFKFNTFFSGRHELKQSIEKELKANPNKIIAIVGMTGIGKTQVAKSIFSELIKDYEIMWWIDAKQNIEDQMVFFAQNWNRIYGDKFGPIKMEGKKPTEVAHQVQEKLRDTKIDWLFVFDNATSYESVKDYLTNNITGKKGHFIVTSINELGWSNKKKLLAFTEEESIEFFSKSLPKLPKETEIKIHNYFKGYPLAIAKAASYIQQNPMINVEGYLKKLNDVLNINDDKMSLVNITEIDDQYKLNSTMALSLIFDEIKTRKPIFTLLKFLSIVGSQNIPINLLETFFKEFVEEDNLTFEDTIQVLLRYALIDFGPQTRPDGTQTLAIHEIVQRTLFSSLNDEEKKDILKKGLSILSYPFKGKNNLLISYIQQNYPFHIQHMEAILILAKKYHVIDENYYKLKVHLLEHYISGLRDYKFASSLMKEILDESKQVPINNDLTKARLNLNISNSLMWRGDYLKAIELAEKSINVLKKYPENKEEYLRTICYLAIAHASLGNAEKSKQYFEAIDSRLHSEGASPHLQYNVHYPKAILYATQGDFQKAKEYFNLTMDSAKKAGVSLKTLLHIVLVEVYIDVMTNNLEKAKDTIRDLYSKDETFSSSTHEISGRIKVLEGLISVKEKRFTEAEAKLGTAEKIMDEWYKSKDFHRNQALCYIAIGQLCTETRQYDRAEKYLKLAESVYDNNGYLKRNMHEVALLYQAFIKLFRLSNNQYERGQYFDKLRRTFGDFSHYTLEAQQS